MADLPGHYYYLCFPAKLLGIAVILHGDTRMPGVNLGKQR